MTTFMLSSRATRSVAIFAAGFCFSMLLSGCVSLGSQPSTHQPLPANWANGSALPSAQAPYAVWWGVFRDPALDRLIARAAAENLTIGQAAYRVTAARALVRPAQAQRLPQIRGSANARWQRRIAGSSDAAASQPRPGSDNDTPSFDTEPRSSGSYQAGFDASWELDLFGGGSATIASTRAAAGIAEADLAAARATVFAEVARTYIELRGAQRRSELLTGAYANQERLLALLEAQRSAGLASDFDVDRARAALGETAAAVPQASREVSTALQRLAVLIGSAVPDPALKLTAPQPSGRNILIAALPADLVRTRPEIRRAEQTVAQAAAEVGVAAADLYPRFTLSGDLTLRGDLGASALLGRSVTIGGGPSITIPLLDWGARRGTLRAREASLSEAILAYRQAILEGFEEVEGALNALGSERTRVVRLRAATESASRAARYANTLFRQGLVPLSDELDAEVNQRRAELLLTEAVEREALAIVALYKALGGISCTNSEVRQPACPGQPEPQNEAS